MPRFRNSGIIIKAAACDHDSRKIKINGNNNSDASSNIKSSGVNGKTPTPSSNLRSPKGSIGSESQLERSVLSSCSTNKSNPVLDFGIEEDYFSSEFTFDYGDNENDYDRNDDDLVNNQKSVQRTTVVWSDGTSASPLPSSPSLSPSSSTSSSISSIRIEVNEKGPVSILKDSPLYSPRKKTAGAIAAAPGAGTNTDSAKKNKVSFGSDVNFRQKRKTPPKKANRGRRSRFKKSHNHASKVAVNMGVGSKSVSGSAVSLANNKHSSSGNRGVSISVSSPILSPKTTIKSKEDHLKCRRTPVSGLASKAPTYGSDSNAAVTPSPSASHSHNRSTKTNISDEVEPGAGRKAQAAASEHASVPPSWIPRRGVAVDTRILKSFMGDAVGKTFHQYCLSFLRSCADHGILPTVVSTTAPKKLKGGSGSQSKIGNRGGCAGRMNSQVGIEARATHLSQILAWKDADKDASDINSSKDNGDDADGASVWKRLLPLVQIRPPCNVNNAKSRNVVHLPKKLLACDSWRIFGDMIDAITLEISINEITSQNASTMPLEITILTSDVTLFADTNTDSHKRALGRLWDRLREKFEGNQIRNVHIVVYRTGVDPLQPHCASSGLMGVQQNIFSEGWNGISSTNAGTKEMQYEFPVDNQLEVPHHFKVAHVAKVVQNHISFLFTKESKRKDSVQHGHGSPIDVRFDMKDFHPLHFQGLIRDWAKGAMSTASGMGRISFELPETLDGTQCSVMLNLSYSILPYPINSKATNGLFQYLHSLSHSYFEVIQLVPLDKVDLSLIFGVPLNAKAGLEGDLEQYREMQKLVRQLWKYLAAEDVALVLRCSRDMNSSSDRGGFYDNGNKQRIFLLMAQISGREGGESVSSGNGTLYQYASHGYQIVESGSYKECDDGADSDYTELIKNSLDFLDKRALNPCVFESYYIDAYQSV